MITKTDELDNYTFHIESDEIEWITVDADSEKGAIAYLEYKLKGILFKSYTLRYVNHVAVKAIDPVENKMYKIKQALKQKNSKIGMKIYCYRPDGRLAKVFYDKHKAADWMWAKFEKRVNAYSLLFCIDHNTTKDKYGRVSSYGMLWRKEMVK